MAIDVEQKFGTLNTNPATSEFPNGSYKNETVPNVSQDGTPVTADTLNDELGFTEALLAAAGLTVNGVVDTALSSQKLDALRILIGKDALRPVLIAQGLSGNYGFFADGFNYNLVGDVGIDVDGKIYTYAGSDTLPVNVAPETDPVGDADFKEISFNAADLITTTQGISVQEYINIENTAGEYLPLDASNQDFIDAATSGKTVKLNKGTYSNLTGEIIITTATNLKIVGHGKNESLIPYGTTIRVNEATNDSYFQGFGTYHETADQDLGNSPKLLDLRKMSGLTTLRDIKYEIVATNPNAGGGGIGIQWLDSSENLLVDDIYTLNCSTAGIWAGRKTPNQFTRCGIAVVKNSRFKKTVDQGFPTGVNVSEVREFYEYNNYYEGYFLTENRQEATTDPNTDNITPRFYTDVLTGSDDSFWIASANNGSGGWDWVQTTASNKCYGLYSGDSDDSSTGIDAPNVLSTSNSKFKNCNYMIGFHWADEIIVDNPIDVDQTCDNGFKNDGIESAQSSRQQPRLIKFNGGVMPNVFFSKVAHVDLANPPLIFGNDRGEFSGIRGYALNATSWNGGSCVIGPVTVKNTARGGIYIDGFERVHISDGYYIENCGSAGNQDINTDAGITIGNTNVDVKYYHIGSGVIRSSPSNAGNMPVGINTWSVRRATYGYISPNIRIEGYTSALANSTGIYGALVTKEPENGQWVGPPFGVYRKGQKVQSQDGRFEGWVCVADNLEYGRYLIWDSSTSYTIGDRVSYGGWEWEALTNNTNSDPLESGQTDWSSVRIVFQRFGESISY